MVLIEEVNNLTDKGNTFSKKIGNTEYIVIVKNAENAKKTATEAYLELCIKELDKENFNIQETKLENDEKTS